jgi:hypothetical protein
VGEREDFGRVGEWHGTLSGRIERGEEEDEQSYEAQARRILVGNEGTESGCKQGPGHLWECEEQKSSSAESVDGEDGGPSKDEVDQTEAETGQQGTQLASTCLLEDGAAVERDDVDTAHLLGNHDGKGGQSGTTHARDGEKLEEALYIVGLAEDLLLEFDLDVNIVKITSGLKRVFAQPEERVVGIAEAILLDVPTRRF